MNITIWDMELTNTTAVVLSTFGAMCLLIVLMTVAAGVTYWIRRRRRAKLAAQGFSRVGQEEVEPAVAVQSDPEDKRDLQQQQQYNQLHVPNEKRNVALVSAQQMKFVPHELPEKEVEFSIDSQGMPAKGMMMPSELVYPTVPNG